VIVPGLVLMVDKPLMPFRSLFLEDQVAGGLEIPLAAIHGGSTKLWASLTMKAYVLRISAKVYR
jgi:hypothetical protein